MTNLLQAAYDQAAKADQEAKERLEKILRPATVKVSKKQPAEKQTWLEEAPLNKPKKQKPSGLRTKQELSGYSANQRWRLAKKFASERMAEEMEGPGAALLTPVLE